MNGPAEGDDSKIIMVNSCVALGCTNRTGNGVSFHRIPCDKETQKLWLIAFNVLSHLIRLKHACVCSDPSLDEDYQFNY